MPVLPSQFTAILSLPLPLFCLRQKKEGAIPCRGSGEAVGCPVRTTEEDAPKGRILHSVPALTVETSYISPEPKRCAERKALNCLLRIIAKLPPFVGVILRKSEQPICDSAPSSVERADLSSTPYCRRAAKSHAGIAAKINLRHLRLQRRPSQRQAAYPNRVARGMRTQATRG